MKTNKSPEIRIALSLDGSVRDIRVVADSVEDREAGLAQLKKLLPAIELAEELLKPSPIESLQSR